MKCICGHYMDEHESTPLMRCAMKDCRCDGWEPPGEGPEIKVWPENLQVGDVVMVPMKILEINPQSEQTWQGVPIEPVHLVLGVEHSDDWVGFTASGTATISANETLEVIREL